MKIREIFLKDPTKEFEKVIKINELAPEILGRELDDYVITEEIKGYLSRILDEFIESRRSKPQWVCAWISGYFGSGKSHFLKALAAILGNLPVKIFGHQDEIQALDYFADKWGFSNFAAILKKEFLVKPVVINLLQVRGLSSGFDSFSYLIYLELMVSQGFSRTPWIAEIERYLKQEGLYKSFLKAFQKVSGKPWEEQRQWPLAVREPMAQALAMIDPKRWPSVELARSAIEDQKKDFNLTPQWLAERLKEEAETLDPIKGRIVLLLDEVGLFIGNNHDRLTELQAIAEAISQDYIRGKVWLIATAQEALEEKIPEISRKESEFQKLRDRFLMKATLTPENVVTVVQKRLLEKKPDEIYFKTLKEQFNANAGRLATGAVLKNVSRDPDRYSKLPSFESFFATYPFLPYHLHILQKILDGIRGKGYGTEGLTGRERSALGIVQGTLSTGDPALIDMEVGQLVTFDRIFDAMEEEVQALKSEEIAIINEIGRLKENDSLPLKKVAKALFLLQHVGSWLPTTAENIAAVLCPRLDHDPYSLFEEVKKCLAILKQNHFVDEKEGQFKLLTKGEKELELKIERYRARIPNIKKQEFTKEILREKLRDFQKLRYKDQDFEIRIEIDESVISAKGYIHLKVYALMEVEPEDFEMETARNKNTVYLIIEPEANFIDELERTLALEMVLDEMRKESLSEEGKTLLREKEKELVDLREDELPKKIVDMLKKGILIHHGEQFQLDADWKNKVRQALLDCVKKTFYEFDRGAVRVRDEEVIKILTWKGGSLPQVYYSLGIIDSSGNIREDAPLLQTILNEIHARVETHKFDRTGKDLINYFSAPPYGWNPNIIKLGLATLLTRGSISLTLEGKTYTYGDAGLVDIFKSSRRLSNARFDLGLTLSPDEEEKASRLLAELFGEHNKITPAEIQEALKKHIQEIKEKGTNLLQRLKDLGFGGQKPIMELLDKCDHLLEKGSAEAMIKEFIIDETVQLFRKNLRILKEFIQFEEEKRFEKTKEIHRFVIEHLKALDPKETNELIQILLSDDLPLRWSNLYESYRKKEDLFRTKYRDLHTKLKEKCTKALERLKHHPAFTRVKEEAEKIMQNHPLPFTCNEAAPLSKPGTYVCTSCGLTFSELKQKFQEIKNWETTVLQKLESLLLKPEEKLTMEQEQSISSPGEIELLMAKIKAFVDKTLKKGKKARLYIKAEEE